MKPTMTGEQEGQLIGYGDNEGERQGLRLVWGELEYNYTTDVGCYQANSPSCCGHLLYQLTPQLK